MRLRIFSQVLYPLAGVLLIIAAWVLACWLLNIPTVVLPSPDKVLRALVVRSDLLLSEGWVTLRETLYGFVLAMPATLLSVIAVMGWLPDWVAKRGGNGDVVRAAGLAMLVVFVFAHLQVCAARFRAGSANGLNIWLAMPTRIRRLGDLTVQAAMISLPTSWTNFSSTAPAAIRMRPVRSTVHSALAAGSAPDGLLSAQLRCPELL